MAMIEEYRRSLKMPDAEELFDLFFYRPIAFVLVKIIYRLPVTPNQVTVSSMICGLVAAWYFSVGIGFSLMWGALWYMVGNILDCADGQLARLQKSGTPLGRLVDGIADYISSFAIFIGIGMGFAVTGDEQWVLVVLTGISSAMHAIVFDHYQNEYISIVRGEKNFTHYEADKISSYAKELESANNKGIRYYILNIYLRYLTIQGNIDTSDLSKNFSGEVYRAHNKAMIRCWSFLGPTTNRTILILSAFAGRLDIFLWIVLIPGNLLLVIAYFIQREIHRRMVSKGEL
jgi:phosphatidylglycerophosphate synthase